MTIGDALSVGSGGWFINEGGTTIYPGVNTGIFAGILTMTCQIWRNTGDTRDTAGKIIEDFTQVGGNLDCLAESFPTRESAIQEIITTKSVTDFVNLMLGASVDVRINDQVRTIARKKDASVYHPGPLHIWKVTRGDDIVAGEIHHIELVLKREAKS